jgi:hypothetical protein
LKNWRISANNWLEGTILTPDRKGCVNLEQKAFDRPKNGGNGGFLRLSVTRETREMRGLDRFTSAQKAAQSVRQAFPQC